MLPIVVHLWVAPGMQHDFAEYERHALAVFEAHGGKVLAAFVPEGAGTGGRPDEIHVLLAPSREAFEAFRQDPAIASLAELRARVVSATEIYLAAEMRDYAP